MTKTILDNTITPWIYKNIEHKNMGEAVIEWVATNQVNTWKVKCNKVEIAHYLCTGLIDLQVKQADQTANINFKSHWHPTAGTDLKAYFTRFMIKDADDEYKHNEMAKPEEPLEDLWKKASSVGSWVDADVVESPKHSEI
jgi:hypothetical protein